MPSACAPPLPRSNAGRGARARLRQASNNLGSVMAARAEGAFQGLERSASPGRPPSEPKPAG